MVGDEAGELQGRIMKDLSYQANELELGSEVQGGAIE